MAALEILFIFVPKDAIRRLSPKVNYCLTRLQKSHAWLDHPGDCAYLHSTNFGDFWSEETCYIVGIPLIKSLKNSWEEGRCSRQVNRAWCTLCGALGIQKKCSNFTPKTLRSASRLSPERRLALREAPSIHGCTLWCTYGCYEAKALVDTN